MFIYIVKSVKSGRCLFLLLVIVVIFIGIALIDLSEPDRTLEYQKSKIFYVCSLLHVFYPDKFNQFPTTGEGLESLRVKLRESFVKDSELKDLFFNGNLGFKDYWERELMYKSDGNKFELISLGEDGKVGGTRYGKDLSSNDVEGCQKKVISK